LPCSFRLKCGHQCRLRCHPYDPDHLEYKCKSRCSKAMALCGHNCKKECGHNGACEPCKEIVYKKIEECGHQIKGFCSSAPTKRDCTSKCEKYLSACGHRCQKLCKEEPCEPCIAQIQARSVCKHEDRQINVLCGKIDQIWLYQEKCTERCSSTLECSHECKAGCGECYGGYLHKPCSEDCDRLENLGFFVVAIRIIDQNKMLILCLLKDSCLRSQMQDPMQLNLFALQREMPK
jgi:hypothetical protein